MTKPGTFAKFNPDIYKKVAELSDSIKTKTKKKGTREDHLVQDMEKVFTPITATSTKIAEKQQPLLEQSYHTRKELETHKPILAQILDETSKGNVTLQKAIESSKVQSVSTMVAKALGSKDDDSGLGIQPNPAGTPLEFTIGNSHVHFDGNEIIVDDDTYEATPGLLALLTKKNPGNVNDYDITQYLDIIKKSKAYRQHPGNQQSKPLSSQAFKWVRIVGPWYQETVLKSKEGKGVASYAFLTAEPNELVKRLVTLFQSTKAGNTGTYNEIHAILDFLKRNKHIQKRLYQRLVNKIKC